MKETLLNRVGRIISGGFNSLVSAIENAVPESVMEAAIHEIDEAITEVQAEMGKLIANAHLANKRVTAEKKEHETLSEKIDLALLEKRDDLAEAAISKQMDIEAQIPVLEKTILDLTGQEKELEGYLIALKAKKRQMAEDLRLFRASKEAAETHSTPNAPHASDRNIEQKVSQAESAFDRILEQTTGIPAAGFHESKKTAAQLNELDELARNKRIRERLAHIKTKNQGSAS